MTAKELREKRAPLAVRIREMADKINAESRDFTAEEKPAWESVNNEYNTLTRQIELADRVEAVEADQQRAAGDRTIGREDRTPDRDRNAGRDGAEAITDEHRSLALQAWFRSQSRKSLSDEQTGACRRLGFNPNVSELDIRLLPTRDYRQLQDTFVNRRSELDRLELRTLGTVSGPSGGYLIPPQTLIRRLEVNMLAFGGVRQVAETISTTSGEPLEWPTADDTSNTGAQLAESTTIGSSVDPSFAKVIWNAYKFSSKPILVPYELLEDSAFDLPGLIGDMLGERLGRITNTKFTTGTGATTPKGIVTCSTAGKTTASATAVTADELMDLVHSIDPAYRSTGCGWMMHDSILLAVRKLKDGNGQYLWSEGLRGGYPDTLLSYPITVNQDMQSSLATATKTFLFGQLNKYKIRRVNGLRLYRLQERYRDTDQDAFIAFVREDGNMLTAGTQPIKHMLQA